MGSTCESLAYIRTGWACTKSNVPSPLNAADSSVLGIWDAYVGGNLQSKEGTGASSIEKGHVLFKPAICALSRLIHISEQEESQIADVLLNVKIKQKKKTLCRKVGQGNKSKSSLLSLPLATKAWICYHDIFGLKGALSGNL